MEAVKINLGKVSITVSKNYWDIDKEYDRLTIVERQSTHTCFLSRKPVPAGVSITNREYWIQFSTWQDIPYEIVQEFGNDPEVAISQKVLTQKFAEIEQEIANILNGTSDIMDRNIHLSQAQINQILLADAITATLSASPSTIFVEVERVINLVANVSTTANEIKIKKGETIIATGSGSSLSGTDSVTPSESVTIAYTAVFTIGGLTKTASRNITAVYPIYYGALASYSSESLTKLNTPTTTVKGTYTIGLDTTPKKIYFKVPKSNVTGITKVELLSDGNYSPVNGSIDSTLGDENYNVWVSDDAYNVASAGNRSFVVNR